ncbi:50S ribosomal protein L29 [Candidatus Peregrinibacteria bacterium]|nr:50S ribosomal protein L29 [Candidatus Peregrinibacteria bacterium]
MKTLEELKSLDEKGLQAELKESRDLYFKNKVDVQNNQAKDSHAIKQYRRQIARVQFLLSNKK